MREVKTYTCRPMSVDSWRQLMAKLMAIRPFPEVLSTLAAGVEVDSANSTLCWRTYYRSSWYIATCF